MLNEHTQKTEQAGDALGNVGVGANRRDFLRLSATCLALSLPILSAAQSRAQDATAPVVPQSPLPVVDARLPYKIADGIWILPDKRTRFVPNIGTVEGNKTMLVIDSGFTLASRRDAALVMGTVRMRPNQTQNRMKSSGRFSL